MAAKLTRLTHKIAIHLHLVGRELLQFSLKVDSPETFGYTLLRSTHTFPMTYLCWRRWKLMRFSKYLRHWLVNYSRIVTQFLRHSCYMLPRRFRR